MLSSHEMHMYLKKALERISLYSYQTWAESLHGESPKSLWLLLDP